MPTILEEIEAKFPVESIECNGRQVWPYLRYYIGTKLTNNAEETKLSSGIVKNFFRYFFYGFFDLLRNYDYLAFSDSTERRKVNDKWVDKSVDPIVELLGNTLVFELPLPNHYSKSEIPTKHIATKYYFYFLEYILYFFQFGKPKLKGEQVLKNILEKYKVNIDYVSLVRKNRAQYWVMNYFLRRFKPKAIFVECSYTNFGRIKAIRDKGVKLVEIQHGLINKSHLAYNVYKQLDKNYFPDYLFSFGENEKAVFSGNNNFISSDKVIPVGHFYLEHLTNNFRADTKLSKIISGYRKVIAVTSQNHPIEKELILFLKKSAELDRKNLFIFIPRGGDFSKYSFSDNIIIADWLNTYQVICHADIHSTVFSTCAVEAPSLGVPNILINIQNLSKQHLSGFFQEDTVNRYADAPEEYISAIHNFNKPDRQQIINSNRSNIVPGYNENIRQALKSIRVI